MPAGHGTRARTRDSFSRGFRQKGYIPLSTYLTNYRLGDYVDIKVNSAVQKVGPQQQHYMPQDIETISLQMLLCTQHVLVHCRVCPTKCTMDAPARSGTSLRELLVLLSTSR